ncbi:sugar-binding protein [Melittangium boletus]|uniref:sugar-binding protein n=1 Tax=Melittangium boletus TaxID=83453 RepID=UPI003DA2FABB
MRGEGTGSTNGWNKAWRTWALGVLFTGGLAAPALAQPASGDVLGKNVSPVELHERQACQGNLCLWHVTVNLAPCSAPVCEDHRLYVTDPKGRVLGSTGDDVLLSRSTTEVRFLGPRRIEILNSTNGLERPGPQSTPDVTVQDNGVDQVTEIRRQRWRVSADGKTLTKEKDPPLPAWKRKTPASAPPPRSPDDTTPRLQVPVSEALLAQARKVCATTTLVPRHHECHGKTCVLVLDKEPTERQSSCDDSPCPVLVKGGKVGPLPLPAMVDTSPNEFKLTPTTYEFTACDGVRGQRGTEQSIPRLHPEHMDFARTQGLHVDGAWPYPVREAKSVEAARALAPTVHAYTRANISHGREAWSDETDLAVAWRLSRVGDTLHLHAEVDDDTVVPFTSGTGVHSDHLELWLTPKPPAARKLGVLLAPEGRLQVRLWRDDSGGEKKEVDEDFAGAAGTWARSDTGYTLDLALPLAAVHDPASPRPSKLTLLVSDADTAGTQETLMGHTGLLYFWSEYPPTIDEYQRAQAHD